ncbi:MAG TPA: nucleoside-diphosphate sugar epimerase/dehydratase [Tepidisphaeraceae bacterium]|jgi:FlaA1/EpsC-like NDP-sugar epimerase|nr:nucleoside-diphosphate sugar epimerase/dehydratase [Tepidisphaeraceae bacterium]
MSASLFRSFVSRLLQGNPAPARATISLSDLLGRPPVNLDTPELQRFLAGKRVMVTGAGGSIGSEICRQAIRFCPQRLLLVERAENALFEIDRELRDRWMGADIRPYVADVCDAGRIGDIFTAEQPQVVFHCAAHKHVPMMELNPGEAIKNNIFGTKTLADAAAAHGVAAFVMVSTDKAVNPTSVMGATKRVAELYVQSLNDAECRMPIAECGRKEEDPSAASFSFGTRHSAFGTSPTRFVAVRFGNVLGSSGSVVPIFQKQIDAGGPVTVTHPEMKRYFMMIPEASQLVMQAGAIARGGEVFILDMGQPVKILDLAHELIRRNGLKPGDDIEVRFSGIRPGEKLYEELACDYERAVPTNHPMIRVWQLPTASASEIDQMLTVLDTASRGSRADAVRALSWCVPEYRPDGAPAPAADVPTVLRLTSSESVAA